FLATLPKAKQEVVKQTAVLLAEAAAHATETKRDLADRLSAVALLAHAPWTTAGPMLSQLLADDSGQEMRIAAVRALAAHPRPEVPGILMKSWRGYLPAVRREVTEAMLRRPEWIVLFLDEVEAGRVKPGDVDPQRSRQLANHGKAEIRDRAQK